MIIKYYTTQGTTIILDNLTDVHIYDSRPLFEGEFNLFEFDRALDKDEKTKFITYARDGACMLVVHATAYVCNDDGKTIEKVCAA